MDLARGRFEASDRIRSPHDKLLGATGVNDDGRAIRGPIRECFPAQLAGLAIQRDDTRVGLAPSAHDEKVADDERCRAGPVTGNLAVEILCQTLFPHNLALGRVETKQMPLRAEGVNFAIVDCGRCPWTIAVFHILVIAGIGMRPERFAGGVVEAQDALDLRIELMIRDDDSSVRDHRSRVTVAHFCPPTNLESRGRNRLDDAGLAPHSIALRPTPLRPIVGLHYQGQQQRQAERTCLKGLLVIHVQGESSTRVYSTTAIA